MGHLTDAQHKTVGHTVLYVPDEGRRMADIHAHRDKDLVQRLEGIGLIPSTVNVISTETQYLFPSTLLEVRIETICFVIYLS